MDSADKIEEIISKFLAGEATPEEAMYLEDWKLKDPKNNQLFEQSQQLFAIANPHEKSFQINKNKAWDKVQAKINQNKKVIPLYKNYGVIIGIAASFIVMISAYFLLRNQTIENDHKVYTILAINKLKQITLNENSKIDLAKGAQLSYDQNFGIKNRNVKLSGSAYFTVKHDDAMPFIVDLGHVYVKDLGTKFDIKLSADTDSIYIKVDEGIVLLFDSASNAIEIKASERALYIKSTKQLFTADDLNTQTSILNFENAKLAYVIAQLEEKFTTKIIVANPKINLCSLSAKFKEDDITTILAVICETLGLSYEKHDGGFIIKGEACN